MLTSSLAAARQLILAKGLYINDEAVPEAQFIATPENLVDGRVLVLRAGKDKIIVLAVAS